MFTFRWFDTIKSFYQNRGLFIRVSLTIISLGESIDRIPRLDIVMDKVKNEDCICIAKELIEKLNGNKLTFDDVGYSASRICYILTRRLNTIHSV